MSDSRPSSRPIAPWKRTAMLVAGIALIPIGFVIMPLPGPFGIPLMALGVLLIVTASRRAAGWVRLYRRRWDWMHEVLERGESWMGGPFGEALRRTNGRGSRVPGPPMPLHWRIIELMLLPVFIALAVARPVARRFGYTLPGSKTPVA